MSRARAVLAGTGRLLLALGAAKALDLAAWVVLARGLGVEGFGRSTGALALALLFNVVADLGLTPVFTREIACGRGAPGALLRRVLALKCVLAGITVAGAAGVAHGLGQPAEAVALTATFASGLVLNSAAQTFEAWLKAEGRAGAAGLAVVAQSAAGAGTCIALVVLGAGPWAAALAYVAGGIAHLVAAAARARALARAKSAVAPTSPGVSLRALLAEALPVALSGLCVGVYFRIDTVLLTHLAGERATGLYGGAYRFFEAFVYLSAAFRSVLYPALARVAAGPPGAFAGVVRRVARGLLVFTLGVAALVSALAPRLVSGVLGPAYATAAPALAILVWALPGAFVADTLFHALVARHGASSAARAVAQAAALNVALNLVLIPPFSFLGAAVATVASECVACALLARSLGRDAGAILDAGLLSRPLALGATFAGVAALAARLAPSYPAIAWVAASLGAVAYVALAARHAGFTAADRALVRGVVAGVLRRRRDAPPPAEPPQQESRAAA